MKTEMSFAKLVAEPSTLVKEAGCVWGKICLDYDDGFFPGQGWTDLVLPICAAWIDAIVALAMGSVGEREICFMDGPYRIACSVVADQQIELRLIEDRVTAKVRRNLLVNSDLLLQEAINVTGRILAECRRNGWTDDDVTALENAQSAAREARRRRLQSLDESFDA